MPHLIDEIVRSIASGSQALTIVSNPDGFLAHGDMSKKLQNESGVEVVVGTAIRLRVHYELYLRRHPERKAIYVLTGKEELRAVSPNVNKVSFSIADLFPNFVDKEAISRQSFDVLSEIFDKHIQGVVSAQRLQDIIENLTSAKAAEASADIGDAVANLNQLSNPDWSDANTIITISKLFVKAVESGRFADVAENIDSLNFDFQHFLDDTYWDSINANPLLRPRCVAGIVSHIRGNYQPAEKVALVVVDGMAFWQYEILRAALEGMQISPKSQDWIYSWIPSITCLSRQAIFSGEHPTLDYTQSPNAERAAWLSHWPTGTPQYFYERHDAEMHIKNGCKRFAYVTVALDEKMHSSSSYLDLLALTKIWANAFAKRIKELKDAGFAVILTTDHGNVLAKGWRAFTSTEKAHLYGKASRGHRHAIFQSHPASDQFKADLGHDVRVLHKGLWFAIRDNHSFSARGVVEITHGGSHLFEAMIPFIKF